MLSFLARVGIVLLVFVFWGMVLIGTPLDDRLLAIGCGLYFLLNLHVCRFSNLGRRGSVLRRLVAGYFYLANRMAGLSLAAFGFATMHVGGGPVALAFLAWIFAAGMISLVLRNSSDVRFVKLALYLPDASARSPASPMFFQSRRIIFRDLNWHSISLAVAAIDLRLGLLVSAGFLTFFIPTFVKVVRALPSIVDAVRGKAFQRTAEGIQKLDPQVICYCSGPPRSTYQLNQWTQVLEQCGKRVLIVIRERHYLTGLNPTALPVVFAKSLSSLEHVMTPSLRVVLYPANGNRNAHMLRRPEICHVFINHGESDKAVNLSKFLRCYDRLYVSGQMAVDRTRAAGLGIADERFVCVGRPQVDLSLAMVERGATLQAPLTILYAPTWEGFDDTTEYSSVAESTIDALEVLLDDKRYRILFKAHPYTGSVRSDVRGALQQMRERLNKANNVVMFDAQADILELMNESDVMISDISSVLIDYLHTEKPIILTNPQGLSIEEYHEQFFSSKAAYILDREMNVLGQTIDSIWAEDPLLAKRLETKEYSLGDWPQGAMARFSEQLDVEWNKTPPRPAPRDDAVSNESE